MATQTGRPGCDQCARPDRQRATPLDANGIERAIEPQSRLAGEIAQCTDDTSRHFLGQLSQHATLLAVAIGDAMTALSRLDGRRPSGRSMLGRSSDPIRAVPSCPRGAGSSRDMRPPGAKVRLAASNSNGRSVQESDGDQSIPVADRFRRPHHASWIVAASW
jgi:hypothetical protein